MKGAIIFKRLDRLLGALEKVFVALCSFALAVMVAINIANLLARNLTGRGIDWVWPLTGTLMTWIVFLAFYPLYRRASDITVEYFVQRMSPNWRSAMRVFSNLCGILMMTVVVLETPQIISRQIGAIEFVGLERYALSVPLIVSSALIIVQLTLNTVMTFLKKPIAPQTKEELPKWSL
ncbi:MAG: TRAP transporter small permease [Variovorax sp.]